MSVQPSADDARSRALLARIARGDQQAMKEFYVMHAPTIYAFARKRLRNEQDAEGVVIETMMVVWNSADRYRQEALVRTWLLGIAKNKCLDVLGRRPPGEHESIDDHHDLADESQVQPWRTVHEGQLQAALRNCMQSLSALHQSVLHLMYFEHLSVTEIVQVIGAPEGTVKSRLRLAYDRLRPCLKAAGFAPGEST